MGGRAATFSQGLRAQRADLLTSREPRIIAPFRSLRVRPALITGTPATPSLSRRLPLAPSARIDGKPFASSIFIVNAVSTLQPPAYAFRSRLTRSWFANCPTWRDYRRPTVNALLFCPCWASVLCFDPFPWSLVCRSCPEKFLPRVKAGKF